MDESSDTTDGQELLRPSAISNRVVETHQRAASWVQGSSTNSADRPKRIRRHPKASSDGKKSARSNGGTVPDGDLSRSQSTDLGSQEELPAAQVVAASAHTSSPSAEKTVSKSQSIPDTSKSSQISKNDMDLLEDFLEMKLHSSREKIGSQSEETGRPTFSFDTLSVSLYEMNEIL